MGVRAHLIRSSQELTMTPVNTPAVFEHSHQTLLLASAGTLCLLCTHGLVPIQLVTKRTQPENDTKQFRASRNELGMTMSNMTRWVILALGFFIVDKWFAFDKPCLAWC